MRHCYPRWTLSLSPTRFFSRAPLSRPGDTCQHQLLITRGALLGGLRGRDTCQSIGLVSALCSTCVYRVRKCPRGAVMPIFWNL